MEGVLPLDWHYPLSRNLFPLRCLAITAPVRKAKIR